MASVPEAAAAEAALAGAVAPEGVAAASDFGAAGALVLPAAPVALPFGAFAGAAFEALPVALPAAFAEGLFGAFAGFAAGDAEVAFDVDPPAAPAAGLPGDAAFGAALAGAAPAPELAPAPEPALPASAAIAPVAAAKAPAHTSANSTRAGCIRRKRLRRASVQGFNHPCSPSGRSGRPLAHRRTFSVTTVSSTAQSGTKVAYRARREACMR